MNGFAIAAAGLLSLAGFAGAASAADLAARTAVKAPAFVAPVYDWSGFFIGLNGGGGSSRECLTITSNAGGPVFSNSEGGYNAAGGPAGGQFGYRWQASSWVFGIEAFGDWADLKGSNSSLTAIIPATNQTRRSEERRVGKECRYRWSPYH